MSAEEKNRNENLSRLAADLFAKSTGGEDLSNKIQRLRDEIKKIIESEDTIFGKLRGLVESFRDIIPEEKQRYNAAIKALSTTAKISQQEIVKAVNNQLEELKILEKGLLSAPSGWRDELKAMEAKSQEMRDQISKLREKIGRLESEEKEIFSGIAAREKEMAVVEKAVGEFFTDISAEIASISKKVEEFAAERTAAQPTPTKGSLISDIPVEEKEVGAQQDEIREPSAPQDTELHKNCPMCGSRMNFHVSEQRWRCYSCAYEELREEKGGGVRTSEIRESAPQETEWQKKCPMCGGQMNFHMKEQMWMCYSCAYEESKTGEVRDETEENREQRIAPKPAPVSEPVFDPSPPLAVPLAALSDDEDGESKEESLPAGKHSDKHPSSKKKTCPVCRKKMNWHQKEKAWRCPFCEYERSI